MKRVIKSNEDILCMANLYPKRTGFPYLIWVDNLGSARNNKHNLPFLEASASGNSSLQTIIRCRAANDS